MKNEPLLDRYPSLVLVADKKLVKIPDQIQQFPRRAYLPVMDESLWKIHSGAVQSISWREDGTHVSLGIWGPDDLIGHAISSINPYYLECLTPVKVTLVPLNDWSPDSNFLIEHIYQLEMLLAIRSCKRIEEMVLQLLKLLSNKFGRVGTQGSIIDLRLTHQDIADLLGTTRVTVTRILQKLEERGVIERLSIRQIILKDSDFWHYQI